MITLLNFNAFLKLMTAMSVTFCIHVDDPRHLNYCTNTVMDCVLDGEEIGFCGSVYLKDMESWK